MAAADLTAGGDWVGYTLLQRLSCCQDLLAPAGSAHKTLALQQVVGDIHQEPGGNTHLQAAVGAALLGAHQVDLVLGAGEPT